MVFYGEKHGTAMVYHQLASQVGLFLKTFDKKFVGAAIEFPVDIAGGLASGVLAVFGKFDGEAVKRTSMQAREESLDYLSCIEVQ